MGRREINPYGISALKSILENYLEAKSTFEKEFNDLYRRVMYIDRLTFLDIDDLDIFGVKLKYGMRVEILVFCDYFNIPTPPGSSIIYDLIELGDKKWKRNEIDLPVEIIKEIYDFYQTAKGRTEKEKLYQTMRHFFPKLSVPFPPPNYIQYFRMAKRGLALPEPEEIALVYDLLGSTTPNGKLRTPEKGLTYEEIAEIRETTVETVRKAIRDCRYYVRHGEYRLDQLVPAAAYDEAVSQQVISRLKPIVFPNLQE